jgi:hypothetical protein
MDKIENNELVLCKVFVWKRKYIYVKEWELELEWFYNVRMRYEDSMLWVIGKHDDVLAVLSWVHNLVNR